VSHNSQDRTLFLRDGRKLGYDEYGLPNGKPVLFMHGFGDSRLFGQLFHDDACRTASRLILLERPGYGLSDFQPGRTLLDWPVDVSEAANALNLDRFGVIGFSGGGPHTAACCYALPERITRAAIISGLAPQNIPETREGTPALMRFLLNTAARVPRLAEIPINLTMIRAFRADAEKQTDRIAALAPAADKAVYADPRIRGIMTANTLEAYRQGAKGAAWDAALFARPWGFDPVDIQTPVHLWHGEADMSVPIANGRYMAKTLPHCTATFLPDEAHLSTIIHYMGAALSTMVDES
jgi:pimeloyl-ACP methyl ester carboxylesterase